MTVRRPLAAIEPACPDCLRMAAATCVDPPHAALRPFYRIPVTVDTSVPVAIVIYRCSACSNWLRRPPPQVDAAKRWLIEAPGR